MPAHLSIGDFSKITHLSVKTLRHYHEVGLLEPAEVGAQSGYRYYSAAQAPTAQVIRRFRDLGVPVREVGEILTTADIDARNALIAQHLDRLEGQLTQTQAAVTSLRRLLQPGVPPIAIEHRTVPSIVTAAIRATVDWDELGAWYGEARAELDQTLHSLGRTATDPNGGLYEHELFTVERGEAVVFVPTADPPVEGRVKPYVVPASDLAVTLHHGPHDDIDITYGRLGSYVTENALAVGGPLRETYLAGPPNTDDATAWRTEIGWPIFRTTASN